MKAPIVGCHVCPAQRAYELDERHLQAPLVEFLGALAPGLGRQWPKPIYGFSLWSVVTGDGPPRVYCPKHAPMPMSLAAA